MYHLGEKVRPVLLKRLRMDFLDTNETWFTITKAQYLEIFPKLHLKYGGFWLIYNNNYYRFRSFFLGVVVEKFDDYEI